MIEITLACCQEDIVHVGIDNLLKRAVTLHRYLLVCAVVAHHIHLRGRQFVAFHLIHPTLHGLYNLRKFKAIYMVPSSGIVAVGREVAPVVRPLERHAEVISLRIERITGMFEMVFMVFSHLSYEYVESTKARMAVTREV